jgi:quercetin dioxygenase-like cupin family protein
MVAGFSISAACVTAVQALAKTSTAPGVTIRTLAQGSVKELPADLPGGKAFVAILDFSQVPGAACGPTCELPGFVYARHGVATFSLPGAAAGSVSPGDAAFTPGSAVHTNDDVWERIGAAAIAVGLIVTVILLSAATWLRGGLRRAIKPTLSLLLIAVGVLVVTGATTNDWYFFAVRPISHRSSPMVRPDGRVTFVSPDLAPVPAGPYIETLSAITVPPGARYDAPNVSGPETLIVVKGTASVHVGNETRQLAGGQATLAQAGTTLAVVNPGSDTLQVLEFAVTPLSASPNS